MDWGGAAAAAPYPVTGGIPLRRGAVTDAGTVALFAGEDERELQAEVLARWPDGSIKWLLADFFADLEPHETRRYTLSCGDGARRDADTDRPPLSWQRVDDGVLVTGFRAQACSACIAAASALTELVSPSLVVAPAAFDDGHGLGGGGSGRGGQRERQDQRRRGHDSMEQPRASPRHQYSSSSAS